MHGTVGKVNNVYMKRADRPRAPRVLLPRPVRAHARSGHPRAHHLGRSGAPRRHRLRQRRRRRRAGRAGAARPRRQADAGGAVGPHRRDAAVDRAHRRSCSRRRTARSARATGKVMLDHWQPGAIEANVKGEISPRLFQWGLPEQVGDASGDHRARRGRRRRLAPPDLAGHRDGQGSAVPRAQARRATSRFDGGTIALDNFDVAHRLPARAARRAPAASRSTAASTTSSGSIASTAASASATELSLRNLDVWLDGTEIAYAQPGWEIKISPQVELVGNGNQLTLRGNIDVVEGRYSQNFDLAGMIFTPKRTNEVAEPFWQGIPLLETMRLALHAQSRGDSVRQEQHRRSAADRRRSTSRARCRSRASTADHGWRRAGASSPPGFRYTFDTDRGQVRFEAEKKIPDETPTIDLSATTDLHRQLRAAAHAAS